MKNKYDFIQFDARVLERNLKRHKITQTEYQKFLKTISDDREQGEELKVFNEKEESPEVSS